MTDPAHLIDISGYNTIADWGKVRADGIVGASIKVTQQVNYVNPLYKQQAQGARDAGVAPGGYHFGDPRVSAAEQASFFVMKGREAGLFNSDCIAPMYDAENWEGGGLVWPSPEVLNAHIKEHIRVVREQTGVLKHLVYGSLSWWQSGWFRPEVWADEDVLLWIAVYNGRPGDLQGWQNPLDALHQHTSTGIVPGIAGKVDKNITLQGRGLSDLLIGGNSMAEFSAAEKNELLAGARKVTTNYAVTDDARPLPIGTPDDVVGHIMSLRARLEQFIESNRIQATALAALSLAEKDRDDADKARDEAILTILRGLSTGDVDVSELAAKLADELPPGISVQDVVNAFRQMAGKITFGQIPSGG